MSRVNFLLISMCFILSPFISAFQNAQNDSPLPNWIDPSRESSDGQGPDIVGKVIPPVGFHIPAEYEPVQAIVLGYQGYTSMLNSIAKIAATEGNVEIWAANRGGSIPGVPADKIKSIPCSIDTVWSRDYGPFGITAEGNLGIVDAIYRHYSYRRNDDRLPSCLAQSKDVPAFGMPLILDGGNLMVDSTGQLFITERVYIWNKDKSVAQVNEILKNYYGIRAIHVFDYAGYPGEPEDGTGHIDMFLKLLNDETILVSVADTEPYKANSLKAIAYFKSLTAPTGNPYKIITVKGWDSGSTWYTYSNSLIVNNVAIVPSYSGHETDNQAALEAYNSAGLIAKPVNTDQSITAGGSIHCVTQQIPRPPNK